MGLLDPKIDKRRTFEMLRKKGAVQAIANFEGGHDEGGVTSITLVYPPPTEGAEPLEKDLKVWYCGGYQYTGSGYKRLSEPKNEDEELSELIQGPVDERYGSWAGEFSAWGKLIWDVEEEKVTMDVSEETPNYTHDEINL
jgi:hypothetical protein